MPWFSALTGGLGEDNPYDAIGRASDEMQRRNRAAVGLDPNGNPLPVNWNPADPNNPQASGQGAALGQALASGQQQPDQQPNATKSDPSMGHLLANLVQYQQREQGFNQAMGAGFGAISQPRDREWVSHIFNVNEPDANQFVQTQQSLASQQQGQDRANSIAAMVNDPKQGPLIAAQLHMDWGTLKAGLVTDPGMLGKIAQALGMPTPEMATLSQLQHTGGTTAAGGGGLPGGATSGDIASLRTLALAGVAPDFARKMVADQINYRNTHGGQEAPYKDNVAAYNRYTADQEERQSSAADFGKTHGQNIDKVTTFQHHLEALKTNPGMIEILGYTPPYKALVKRMLQHPEESISEAATALPNWAGNIGGVSQQVKDTISELRQLRGQEYANALHSIGTRFSTQEVQGVQSGMDQLLNIELDPKAYVEQAIDPAIDQTKTIRANSHGAAQDFDTMDPDLRTYVNPTFTKGGRRNIEGSGSEDWADKVKMDAEDQAKAKQILESGAVNKATGQPWTRAQLDKYFRSKGKRPMGY